MNFERGRGSESEKRMLADREPYIWRDGQKFENPNYRKHDALCPTKKQSEDIRFK